MAAKLEAVFRELTEEEQAKAEVMLKTLPPGAIEKAQERLLALEPKKAAEMVRSVLAQPELVKVMG